VNTRSRWQGRVRKKLPRDRGKTFMVLSGLAAIALGGAVIAQSQAAVGVPTTGPAVRVGIRQVPQLIHGVKIVPRPAVAHSGSQSGVESPPNSPSGNLTSRCFPVAPGATNVVLPQEITVTPPTVAVVLGYASNDCQGLAPLAVVADKLGPSASAPSTWFIDGKWRFLGERRP